MQRAPKAAGAGPRAGGVAGAGAGPLSALAVSCTVLLRTAVETGRALWRRRDALAFDDLVLTSALGVLTFALAWLGAGLALAAVAAAAGRADGLVARMAGRLSPAVCRRLVATVCGAVAAAGPAGVAPAVGVDVTSGDRRQPSDGALVGPLPTALPMPDRPVPGVLPTASTAADRSALLVRVRAGDTLWSIAADSLPRNASDADVAAAWPRWYRANRVRIGPDPHLIHPGTRLHPPLRAR